MYPKLYPKDGGEAVNLLIPVKTRETEGGGHSHLFTRDIISAITDTKKEAGQYHIAVVIIAANWSPAELKTIEGEIDLIFHFNMSPNKFVGFDDDTQITLNKYLEGLLNEGDN